MISSLVTSQTSSTNGPSVQLAWDPSTDPNVTNYNIYYGYAHAQYIIGPIPVGNVTNCTLTNLAFGWNTNYYFVGTAVDNAGLESDYSNEASFFAATNNIGTATNVIPPVLSITGTTTP